MKYLCFAFLFVCVSTQAQWKSYRLVNENRDTINCIDNNDMRQGRWVIKVESLRGEPGYEEEGVYKDGKKEGMWRAYTAMGDLFAVERYRWGNKNGVSQYYGISGLVREESWKAVNPDNPFDTVDVYDPINPNKVERVQVKLEGTSLKHGQWKFYEAGSGTLTKSESYFLGKLQDPNKIAAEGSGATSDSSTVTAKPVEPPKKVKPQAVLDFEKKAGKKGKKMKDGSTF